MSTEDRELKAVCEEIRGRQRFLGGPKHVADLLSNLMARRGYAQVKSAADCAATIGVKETSRAIAIAMVSKVRMIPPFQSMEISAGEMTSLLCSPSESHFL